MGDHCEPKEGLWTCSRNEDYWPGEQFFATREEAAAFGAGEYSEGSFHTGRVSMLKEQEVIDAFLRDVDDADEHLGCQDRWGWVEDEILGVSQDQFEELQDLVMWWIRKHNLVPGRFWVVEDVEVHDAEEVGHG